MTANPDPRLDEIEDRLYAITTGPWEHQPYGDQNQNGDYCGGYILDGHGEYLISEVSDRDGPFIANAPTDVAYLLAELRKAHEALAAVEKLERRWATLAEGDRYYARRIRESIRAAVAAANRDGQ